MIFLWLTGCWCAGCAVGSALGGHPGPAFEYGLLAATQALAAWSVTK